MDMSEYAYEKEEKLERLALEDEIYRVWRRSFEDCIRPFTEYANSQPQEIQNILWGYAEAGRMMLQRKVNLACAYMEFQE